MNSRQVLITLIVLIVLLFVSGIAFKFGMIVASFDRVINCSPIETFYSSAWSVYTTIFGVVGVVLGVVFPLYQAKEQREEYKDEINKINQKINDLANVKEALKNNIIHIEIEKIKNEYDLYNNDDDKRSKVLTKFKIFNERLNYENAENILSFFYQKSYLLKDGAPKTSSDIASFTADISFHNDFSEDEKLKIFKKAIQIGYGLIYATSLKPPKINSRTESGLQLLKELYVEARKRGYESVLTQVEENYSRLLAELKKLNDKKDAKYKNEYGHAIRLVNHLILDLKNDNWGVSFVGKEELEKLLERER